MPPPWRLSITPDWIQFHHLAVRDDLDPELRGVASQARLREIANLLEFLRLLGEEPIAIAAHALYEMDRTPQPFQEGNHRTSYRMADSILYCLIGRNVLMGNLFALPRGLGVHEIIAWLRDRIV